MRFLRSLPRLAALPLACTLSVASANTPLTPGTSVSGDVQASTGQHWQLALHKGDLVIGHLKGDASLRLLDEQGQPQRLLVDGTDMLRDFMFVADRDGPVTLLPERAGAWQPTHYELQISRIVPLTEQHPSAESIESPTLQALKDSIPKGGTTQAFWAERERQGTPLVEPVGAGSDAMRVTFLWRGARHGVTLFGAPSGDHDALAQLPGTDVWYRSYVVPAGTRMSYQLAPDVPQLDERFPDRRRAVLATLQRDPLNPRTFASEPGDDKYRQRSLLVLQGAPAQPWLQADSQAAKGTLERVAVDSKALGNRRDVYLYRPAGWQADSAERGLLVLFDAQAYLRQVPTPALLDNLIAAKRIPPTAALLVGNPSAESRGHELPPNPLFARFLSEELLPWAKRQGISAEGHRTVLAGSSYGGIASTYAALRYPHQFGNVLSLSGSYWWSPHGEEPGWLTRFARDAQHEPVRFFMRAGLFERGHGGHMDLLGSNRHMRDVLVAKGYAVNYGEYAGGHDYAQWGGELATGLEALLGNSGQALPD
ncbi:enterochelin esterase [Pseudomonas sp. Marseille-Q5115]|uniref:enterochelin esterase n=1 Tax=Pseudomonas sp. Marseille-Q5115 TaxID=2866593 RepID=UPI001CE452BF|nr:enterochelin esterase [Pseudomonas sp. Marseille-Q5115]